MTGYVDDELRALITVEIRAEKQGRPSSVEVWIDTAYNGMLLMPHSAIESAGLKPSTYLRAVLADGKEVRLPTYLCYLDWFGARYKIHVVCGDGQNALLGTAVLEDRDLTISYRNRTVTLT